MSTVQPIAWSADDYEHAAREYERSLPLEHFMEALPQSTQRKITLESLDVLRIRRPGVQVFNELLIQYFFEGQLHRVVPDNMVRLCQDAPQTKGSFNVELEPSQPMLVLEYVSPETMRKDYKDSFAKYERELKVPYCLMFYPERLDLRVWQHAGEAYERVAANAQGRYAILDLDLEVAVQDGWLRYWYQGDLLPLPDELLRQVDQERQRADDERQRADDERQRADDERQRADDERQRRETAEAEVTRLRALLAEAQPGQTGPRRPRKRK